jgi:glutathione S-transferase
MEYVYLVIVLALLEYIVLTGLVARARGKFGIKAPACAGHPEFERTFRVQQNTLEGLVVFLPGLWLFGTFVNPPIAALIGVTGIIGRGIYAQAYISAAEKRGPGAAICGFANMALVIGALIGVIRALL